jgi:hypothetical protein
MPPAEKPPASKEEPPESAPVTDPKAIDPDDAQIEPPKDDVFKKK